MTATRTTPPVMAYVSSCVLTISGGIFIYEILRNTDLSFSPIWNMFKSPIGGGCICIGFVMALIFWGKFGHWSAKPVVETRDSFGRITREEDYDISNQMFAKFLLPLMGHFVVEPLLYGALIFYPLMCIVWVVGSAFPYIISFLIVLTMVGAWLFALGQSVNEKLIVFVVGCLIFTTGYAVGSYLIDRNASPRQVETQVEESIYNSPVMDDSEPGIGGETINDDDFE